LDSVGSSAFSAFSRRSAFLRSRALSVPFVGFAVTAMGAAAAPAVARFFLGSSFRSQTPQRLLAMK
jgi:hypothetical protein